MTEPTAVKLDPFDRDMLKVFREMKKLKKENERARGLLERAAGLLVLADTDSGELFDEIHTFLRKKP